MDNTYVSKGIMSVRPPCGDCGYPLTGELKSIYETRDGVKLKIGYVSRCPKCGKVNHLDMAQKVYAHG